MMPLVLGLSTQESITDFTEVFHDLFFNIHWDKPKNEAPKGRIMDFLKRYKFKV